MNRLSVCLQMRMSVYLVVTRVTPTLGAVTSSGRISVSVTRASTAMDTLVLVGKGCVVCVFVCYPLVSCKHYFLCMSITCVCLQTLRSVL